MIDRDLVKEYRLRSPDSGLKEAVDQVRLGWKPTPTEEELFFEDRRFVEEYKRWEELTKDWSQDDKDYIWNFIAVASLPYA
jgi:hypothetical protein